jgi:hypothetical protein
MYNTAGAASLQTIDNKAFFALALTPVQRNERSAVSPRTSVRMVATRDFSGLVSSAWALASAAAIVPICSLDRCTALLLDAHEIKADGTRFRPLGANAMAYRLLRIVRH